MPYVIQRTDGSPWFVSPPGSRGSYTPDLLRARTFATREEAERERCPDNERVVALDHLVRRPEEA